MRRRGGIRLEGWRTTEAKNGPVCRTCQGDFCTKRKRQNRNCKFLLPEFFRDTAVELAGVIYYTVHLAAGHHGGWKSAV